MFGAAGKVEIHLFHHNVKLVLVFEREGNVDIDAIMLVMY